MKQEIKQHSVEMVATTQYILCFPKKFGRGKGRQLAEFQVAKKAIRPQSDKQSDQLIFFIPTLIPFFQTPIYSTVSVCI